MIFTIPDDYTIPNNLEFKFKEYCFGNEWILTWDGNKWDGRNFQGRINKKVINKCNTPCEVEINGVGTMNIRNCYGAWIMIKVSDWNKKYLPEHSKGLGYSLWENSTKKFKFLMKDVTIKDCSETLNYITSL